MSNINKKQIIYYTTVFTVAFFLGVMFDHYVLCKSVDPQEEVKEGSGLEIVVEKEEQEQEQGIKHKSVEKESGCTMYVDVSGAVRNPGVYCLDDDSLVIDGVNRAGGFTKDSASKFVYRRINLAQPLVNNQKLYFPYEDELVCELKPVLDEGKKIEIMYNEPVVYLPTTEPYIDQSPTTTPSSPSSGTTSSNDTQCVNVNTATKEQLITLNGVGESTAEKIIQGRPYSKVEDLLNVSGIGEATLAKFEDMVCI